MDLPQAFKEKMKGLLGEEYTEFLESYEKERKQGLRLNLLKTSQERFEKEAPFSCPRFHGQRRDTITERRIALAFIHTMRQASIIFRSPAPWRWQRF